jgi:hypothetical protein
VERLIDTSTGSAVLDLDRLAGAGWHLRVTRFGADGWEDGGAIWFEHTEAMTRPRTLPEFLSSELGVPTAEAEGLAQDILGPWLQQWESRGGRERAKGVNRLSATLMAGVGVLIVLACLGVALLIWLLVT